MVGQGNTVSSGAYRLFAQRCYCTVYIMAWIALFICESIKEENCQLLHVYFESIMFKITLLTH